ncbi:MAG: SIR2 family protein [Fluviicola sp.]|nr:SIR2 family protein [Fluviicola sp.]
MDIIENRITEIIQKFPSSPYLFIGSGFSRRYLNLEDWEGLLKKFCSSIRQYEYYKSKNDGNLPKIAASMCIDYNEMIWSENNSAAIDFRNTHLTKLLHSSSALKIAISDYLIKIGEENVNPQYSNEIEDFKKVSIEGIITTNWDNYLNILFPHFEPIIGQDELISSNSFGVGEIFKIHGCSTKHDSLVLTDEDYLDFNKRYAYLAAKLVTYFIEHPVIFIGYSLTDENVTEILSSIIVSLGKKDIGKLGNNFIFVQRASDEERIDFTYKDIGGTQIPIIVIQLSDYSKLYRPLSQIKRKIPVKIVRYLKEQFMEFIETNDPTAKVAVIDIDDNTSTDKLELAIGVGIIRKLGAVGYKNIKAGDIIEEVLFENKSYDAKEIIEQTLPDSKGFIPIYYFLSKVKKYDVSKLKSNAETNYKHELKDLQIKQYQSHFKTHYDKSKLEDIFLLLLKDYDKAMRLIPFYDFSKETSELDKLGDYLKEHFHDYFKDGKDFRKGGSSNYRKAVCLYDMLKYQNITTSKIEVKPNDIKIKKKDILDETSSN